MLLSLLHQQVVTLRFARSFEDAFPELQDLEFRLKEIIQFFARKPMGPFSRRLFVAEHMQKVETASAQDAADFAGGRRAVLRFEHMEASAVVREIDELVFDGDLPDVSVWKKPNSPAWEAFSRASFTAEGLMSMPITLNPCWIRKTASCPGPVPMSRACLPAGRPGPPTGMEPLVTSRTRSGSGPPAFQGKASGAVVR